MSTMLAIGDRAQMLRLPRLDPRDLHHRSPRLIVGAFSLTPGVLWGRHERQKSRSIYDQMLEALRLTRAEATTVVLDAGTPTNHAQTRRLRRIANTLADELAVAARNSLGIDLSAFSIMINCTRSHDPEGQRIRAVVDENLQDLVSSNGALGPTTPLTVEARHLHDHSLHEMFEKAQL